MAVLENEFHEAMVNIYKVALQECNYRPQAFLKMVAQIGGVETAKKLLSTDVMQSGLYELFECGRLDLTVESLVVKEQYRHLFSEAEISEANRRLNLLRD